MTLIIYVTCQDAALRCILGRIQEIHKNGFRMHGRPSERQWIRAADFVAVERKTAAVVCQIVTVDNLTAHCQDVAELLMVCEVCRGKDGLDLTVLYRSYSSTVQSLPQRDRPI